MSDAQPYIITTSPTDTLPMLGRTVLLRVTSPDGEEASAQVWAWTLDKAHRRARALGEYRARQHAEKLRETRTVTFDPDAP